MFFFLLLGPAYRGMVLANVAVTGRLRVSAGPVDQVSKAFPALLPPKSLCLAQDSIGQQQLSLSGGRRVVGFGSEWGVLDTILPFAATPQPILNRRVDGRTSIKHRDQRECEGPQR